jgi:hypothetical protein
MISLTHNCETCPDAFIPSADKITQKLARGQLRSSIQITYYMGKPGRGWEFFSSPPRPDRSGGHSASYLMGTGGSVPASKAAGAWSWSLTSI